MRAVTLSFTGETSQFTVIDFPVPERKSPQDVLVRVLSVGLDGTDREMMERKYTVPPPGTSELIIGHESLGVVVEAGEASGLRPGDYVTALVRRPCPDPGCINCRNGRSDYCETGKYVERGIRGAHGYLSEYYVEEAQYLVKIAPECASFGVLVEPQSIVEKVWDQVQHVQRRLFWQPRTALITGAGPLGLLAAMMCRQLGLETHVWSNNPVDSLQAGIVREIGGHYREAGKSSKPGEPGSLSEYVNSYERPPDLILECTGHSPLAFEAMTALAPNGVLALLGVTPGDLHADVPADKINWHMVGKNKSVIGSVNASRQDFEAGIERLRQTDLRHPGLLSKLFTDRLTMEEMPQLDFANVQLKAVVEIK